MNKQIDGFSKLREFTIQTAKKQKKPSKASVSEKLARAVCSKIGEGDIRGSVRLLTSDCGIADNDDMTLKLLQEKQLPEPPDRRPFPNSICDPLSLTVDDIRRRVMSFQPGSAAGKRTAWGKVKISTSFSVL